MLAISGMGASIMHNKQDPTMRSVRVNNQITENKQPRPWVTICAMHFIFLQFGWDFSIIFCVCNGFKKTPVMGSTCSFLHCGWQLLRTSTKFLNCPLTIFLITYLQVLLTCFCGALLSSWPQLVIFHILIHFLPCSSINVLFMLYLMFVLCINYLYVSC